MAIATTYMGLMGVDQTLVGTPQVDPMLALNIT